VIDGRGCTRLVCERVWEAVAWDAGAEEEDEEEEASASGSGSGSGVERRSAPPSVISSEGYGSGGSSFLVRFQFVDVVLRLALSKYVKVRDRRGLGRARASSRLSLCGWAHGVCMCVDVCVVCAGARDAVGDDGRGHAVGAVRGAPLPASRAGGPRSLPSSSPLRARGDGAARC